MSLRKKPPVITPELEEQLDRAGPSETVAVVFHLHPEVASGEAAKKTTRELIERATAATGKRPSTTNVFEFLGSFLVVATASFVRALAQQPEVIRATPNFTREQEGWKKP